MQHLHRSPTPLPHLCEILVRISFTLGIATAILAMAPAPAATQETIQIPRERLLQIAPDSLLSQSVAVIGEARGENVAIQEDALALDPGEFAVLRTGERPRAIPGPVQAVDQAGALPQAGPARPARDAAADPFFTTELRLVTPDGQRTGEWILRPVYKVASRMRWEAADRRFRGRLLLALEDSLRRGETRPLENPVRFRLLGDAEPDPSELTIQHTNFPLQAIDLSATRAADSIRIHLVPQFDLTAGVDIWVPVEPALQIEVTPNRIQGWGIETARIVLRVIGTSTGSERVGSLTASAGELDSVEVPLNAAGTGVVRLRSAGAGPSTLRASALGLGEATATIVYVWPWVFFLAAVLGGVFGGVARAAHAGRGKGQYFDFALKGVFAGLLAALAWYALGINLLQLDFGLPRQNELAVFALAALAGYFGISRISKRGERAEELLAHQ